MGILTAILALLSCALIGTGLWLVLRDQRRSQGLGSASPRLTAPAEFSNSNAVRLAPAPQGEISLAAPSTRGHGNPAPPDTAPPEGPQGTLEADLVSALRAVNGAFAPAGISLIREARTAGEGVPDAPLVAAALMAGERRAGVLHVVMAEGAVELTAASEIAGPEGVQRVRRLLQHEANIPALAEAIAACVWPVVQRTLLSRPGRP